MGAHCPLHMASLPTRTHSLTPYITKVPHTVNMEATLYGNRDVSVTMFEAPIEETMGPDEWVMVPASVPNRQVWEGPIVWNASRGRVMRRGEYRSQVMPSDLAPTHTEGKPPPYQSTGETYGPRSRWLASSRLLASTPVAKFVDNGF